MSAGLELTVVSDRHGDGSLGLHSCVLRMRNVVHLGGDHYVMKQLCVFGGTRSAGGAAQVQLVIALKLREQLW